MDRPVHPIQMLWMAIPRAQFFMVVFIGSILVSHLIAGIRLVHPDKFDDVQETVRVLPTSALIVTAHPDDEAMFFGPAIQGLALAGTMLSALCLSTGNAAGLGSQRVAELYASYNELGLPSSRIKYIDDARLQDSMQTVWPNGYVSSLIGKHIDSLSKTDPIDALITFDDRGASEHTNHITAFNATRDLALQRNIPLYVLPTLEVWEKYTSVPLAVWETVMYSGHPPVAPTGKKLPMEASAEYKPALEIQVLASPAQYLKAVNAMFKHKTQLEWFRYLYLMFSRYMYLNKLVLWTPEYQN